MAEHNADVVIVGFGAAGAAAAIAAHDAGASVLIVEKMSEATAGGSTRVSGNVWFDPHDPQIVSTYLQELCGERRLDPSLITAWSTEVVRNTEWVRGLGAKTGFMRMPFEYPELPSHECDPGYNYVMPSWGMGRLYQTLKDAVRARRIEVLYESPATRLRREPGGRVVGVGVQVRAEPAFIGARCGVVLASGGFTRSPQLARTFLRLPNVCPWGSPAASGDGLLMAQEVGAGLANMENYMQTLGLSADGFASGFNTALAAKTGWIVVDYGARRFADETAKNSHGKIQDGRRYKLFPDRPCFVIFDEQIRRAGPLVASIETQGYGWNQCIEGYRWSADNLAEIDKGWIARADTPEQLGQLLGIDGVQLARTIARYNNACAHGCDDAFGRRPQTLTALVQGPFYGFASGHLLAFTHGGPAKDGAGRVLDPFGNPIPGLYAAGEVASTYSHCVSGGFMIADALAFGRVAGRSAARGTAGQNAVMSQRFSTSLTHN